VRDLQHAHKALYADLKARLPQDAPRETTPPVSQNSSPSDEQNFAYKEATNQQPSNELDTGNPADLNVDVQVRQQQAPVANGNEDRSGSLAEAQAGRGEVSRAPENPIATGPAPIPPARAGKGSAHSCGLEHLTWKQIMMAASDRFMDRLVCHTAGMQRPFVAGDCVRAAYDLTRSLGISHTIWAEACAVLGDKAAAVCVILIDHAMHRPDNTVRKPGAYFRAMIRKSQAGELHLHKSVFGILGRGRGQGAA
jgi:hypothetical protein